jgi:hypothetical protein
VQMYALCSFPFSALELAKQVHTCSACSTITALQRGSLSLIGAQLAIFKLATHHW